MTFFANSGVTWPEFERDTRAAGTDALRTASSLYRLFADLESGKTPYVNESDIRLYAETLDGIAALYERIGSRLKSETIPGGLLTEHEISEWFGPYPFVESWPRDWITGSSIQVGLIFQELADRANKLAEAIRDLKPETRAWDLAPSVFRVMAQWEGFERLARFVAAINRHKP